MDCKDLMIGDWVNIKGKPVKVSLDDLRTMLILFEDVDFHIEPIPLTEEILVKNGFDWEILSKFNAALMAYICGEIQCDNDWRTPRIQYVHQLQHLLRLCGIEKEIEL